MLQSSICFSGITYKDSSLYFISKEHYWCGFLLIILSMGPVLSSMYVHFSRVCTELEKSGKMTLVLENSLNSKKVQFVFELSLNFEKISLIITKSP